MRHYVTIACLLQPFLLAFAAADEERRFFPSLMEVKEDGEWTEITDNSGLIWEAGRHPGVREFRFRFVLPDDWDKEQRMAFSPGVVTSVCEVFCQDEMIGRKGKLNPQTGTLWMGRSEIFELPSKLSRGETIEVEMRVKTYGSIGGLRDGKPYLGSWNALAAGRDQIAPRILIGMLTGVGILFLFGLMAILSSPRDLVGWLFLGVVASEWLELLARAAVLFDGSVQMQVLTTSLATLFWGFLSYPFWMLLMNRLASGDHARMLKWVTIVSFFVGLPIALIGFRDSTEDWFYPVYGWFNLGLFGCGTLLIIALIRRRKRYARLFLVLWLIGHSGVLFDLALASGMANVSEEGWWVSPTNFTILIPLTGFAWLVSRRLQEDRARASELAGRLLTIQDDERRLLARELHDGVAQNLQAMKLQLELGENATISADERERIIQWLETTSEEVRHASRHLHPSILESRSLLEAVEDFCDSLRKTGLVVTTDIDSGIELSRVVEGNLYRIMQEGIANAIRHGSASTIWISLKEEESDFCCLTIRDNGVGMDEAAGGLGCRSIRERAELCGGSATWRSHEGVELTVRVRKALPG